MNEFSPDIWRLQTQGDIRGLIEAIKHASPDVRRRAAAALRTLGVSSAIPALQAALVREHDNEVRSAFILTLDYLFQQEVDEDSDSGDNQHSQVVRLIAQLSSRQPDRIIRAARRLGELKEKIAAESLILVFHNHELPGRVRLAAAEALLQLESAPVEVTLLRALRHTDSRVRRNAIAVLGQLDADWAVAPLAEALRDTNDLIQRTAQAALKRIGTPEALIALAAAALPEARLQPPASPPPAAPPPAIPVVQPPAPPPDEPKAVPVPAAPPAVLPPNEKAEPVPAAPASSVPPVPTSPQGESKVEAPPAAPPVKPNEPVEAPPPASVLDTAVPNALPAITLSDSLSLPDDEATQPTQPVS